jgi:hypothetical protein
MGNAFDLEGMAERFLLLTDKTRILGSAIAKNGTLQGVIAYLTEDQANGDPKVVAHANHFLALLSDVYGFIETYRVKQGEEERFRALQRGAEALEEKACEQLKLYRDQVDRVARGGTLYEEPEWGIISAYTEMRAEEERWLVMEMTVKLETRDTYAQQARALVADERSIFSQVYGTSGQCFRAARQEDEDSPSLR